MKMKWLLILLTAGVFGLFVYNQLSDQLADPDGFYHMKMAQLMVQQGVIKDFWWLPYTTLSQHYIDQHFLFHVLMIPFVTVLADPFVGVKIFTALLGTLAIIGLAQLMRSLKLRWWFPISVILGLTITFTFRMNLIKATPLSLVLLYAIIWCLHKRKYWWLVLLNFIYVWTYGGFAFALIIGITWAISELIMERHRSMWWQQGKLLGVILLGLGLGIVFNPYFPNNLQFYWDQVVQIGVINYQDKISVGSEWYPYEPSQLLLSSIVLTLSALGGLVGIVLQRRKLTQLDWFGFGIAFIGCVLTFKSRRYVEYFGPLITLAAAIWLNHTQLTVTQLYTWLTGRIKPLLGYTILAAVLVMSVIPIISRDTAQNVRDVRSGISVNKYKAASEWLAVNGTPYTKVLHSDWDDFPSLFYYDSNHAYMAGLDPTFMYRYNQDLYWMWVNITVGKYDGDIDSALTTLDVSYIMIEHDHKAMYNLIQRSSLVTKVYHDAEADIFEVKLR